MTAQTYDEFMAEAEKSDPERFALVAAKYQVFSHSKMRHKPEREISVSQLKNHNARRYYWDLFYGGSEADKLDYVTIPANQ